MATKGGLSPEPGKQGSWSEEMEKEDPLIADGAAASIGGQGNTNGTRKAMSWAERLGTTIPTSLTKNILEVVLEKDGKGAFVVSEEDCARLLRRLGLDSRPGVQVEGVQICPGGRGVIFITLKDGITVENFCRYDVFELTENGIRSIMVKPSGKKEVVVTLKGIHPNTRDSLVLDYLSKFGKIVSTKAVHGTFPSGPLRGMKNGDRSYKVEVRPGENIGSYHVIESQKVSLRYPGQHQTCGRCHQTPQRCPGRGIARKCQAEGGEKVEFTDYILELWKRIGYSPKNTDCVNDATTEQSEEVEVVDTFTPAKAPTEQVFVGVTIRNLPRDADHGLVTEFLHQNGLPADKSDDIMFKSNGSISIKHLNNETCQALIAGIHETEVFGKKLYCNGIVPLTPKKVENEAQPQLVGNNLNSEIQSTTKCSSSEVERAPAVSQPTSPTSPLTSPPGSTPTTVPPSESSARGSAPGRSPGFCQVPEKSVQEENSQFVRRHSLSLVNRTPPQGSLASEILSLTPRPDLSRTQNLVTELKEYLSDFGEFASCASEASENDARENADAMETSDENLEGAVPQSLNEKKRMKRSKRKSRDTPRKENFLKKPNLVLSPTQF